MMRPPSPRRKKVAQKNFPIPSGLNIIYQTADGTAIRPPRVMYVIEALCAAECLPVIAIEIAPCGNPVARRAVIPARRRLSPDEIDATMARDLSGRGGTLHRIHG